eukprot:COSAG02_NODE_4374_length_5438_cov_2.542424_4_plen_268_part_00
MFKLEKQTAVIDNEWKLLEEPSDGQCQMEEPYASMSDEQIAGPFLFDLSSSPSETVDSKVEQSSRFAAMMQSMAAFKTSVEFSAEHESLCASPGGGGGGHPPPPPPPMPLSPPVCTGTCFQLKLPSGQCLTLPELKKHTALIVGPCDGGSAWQESAQKKRLKMVENSASELQGNSCAKIDLKDQAGHVDCTASSAVVLIGSCDKINHPPTNGFLLNKYVHPFGKNSSRTATLSSLECRGMCVTINAKGDGFVLGSCGTATRFEYLEL